MKKFLIPSFIVLFSLTSLVVRPVFADSGSSTVQKALENTKQFLDDLVTAKDESSGDDVSLRIQTFRQVLDLSETEAKDFEFKILAVDKDDKLDAWKKSTLAKFDESISFFDSEKSLVSDDKSVDLAKIKEIAQDFKSWRDANYLPLVNQTQDFLLIKQEAKSIQTAQSRLSKITGDLKNLNRTKITGSDGINKLLNSSKSSIAGAADLNNQAYSAFLKNYVSSIMASSTASSTTPNNEEATSSASGNVPQFSAAPTTTDPTDGLKGFLPTSTMINSTSTAASGTAPVILPNPPIVSIKDLVRSSLNKIKDAYQGFIDISNLVRK